MHMHGRQFQTNLCAELPLFNYAYLFRSAGANSLPSTKMCAIRTFCTRTHGIFACETVTHSLGPLLRPYFLTWIPYEIRVGRQTYDHINPRARLNAFCLFRANVRAKKMRKIENTQTQTRPILHFSYFEVSILCLLNERKLPMFTMWTSSQPIAHGAININGIIIIRILITAMIHGPRSLHTEIGAVMDARRA